MRYHGKRHQEHNETYGTRPSECILSRFEWFMAQSDFPIKGNQNPVIRALARHGLEPPLTFRYVREFGRSDDE